MADGMGLPRGLVAIAAVSAAVSAVAFLCAGASAAGEKVPEGDSIKKKVELLYNGGIPANNGAEREKVFLEIDNILKKDKKGIALKSPDFWSDAVQEGRFPGSKTLKFGKLKAVVEENIEVKAGVKAKIAYRAGSFVKESKACPLLLTILERGADAKAYLDATWPAADDKGAPTEMGKSWVVAAMALSDEFPADKEPLLLMQPYAYLWTRYPVDMNRFYVEAVGAACEAVQTFGASNGANRLAGLALRGPTKAVTTPNSASFPTLVVYSETSKEGAAVSDAYKKLEESRKPEEKVNEELKVADVPSVTAQNDQVLAWLGRHPKRAWLKDSTYVVTLSETDGDPWTGSLFIDAPAKRGQPTKVTVKYLRDSNTVDIQCDNLGQFSLFMNDELLDLDKEVAIFVNGTPLAKKTFDRNYRDMFTTADTMADYGHMYLAQYKGVVKATGVTPPAPAPGPDNQPPAGNPPPAGNQPPGGNPPAGGDKPPK